MDTSQTLLAIGPVAAVLSAVAAWWGILLTARDNRARSQPMLVAEFQHGDHSDQSIQLVIRNAGATPAANVEVQFHPPLEPEKWGSHAWMINHRYTDPLSTLSPGQNLRSSWWLTDPTVRDPEEQLNANFHDLPPQTTVTFRYTGLGRKRHSQSYELDVRPHLLEAFPVSSSSALGRLGGIEKQLQQTAKALNTIKSHLQRQTSNKGPVTSEDEIK